jgi:hypothetical protein
VLPALVVAGRVARTSTERCRQEKRLAQLARVCGQFPAADIARTADAWRGATIGRRPLIAVVLGIRSVGSCAADMVMINAAVVGGQHRAVPALVELQSTPALGRTAT